MKRKALSLMLAAACLAGTASAQQCATDENFQRLAKKYPEMIKAQSEFEQSLMDAAGKIDLSKLHRTTGVDQSGNKEFWYDIPVVVHVIHDYGAEENETKDDDIFNYLKDWNAVFAKKNTDTADIIAPFKKWAGNSHIRLHLATKDPLGNPTKGITRRRSYLTYFGGDQAKYDVWAPTSYMNIWIINKMDAGHAGAAAYAQFPSSAIYAPYYDGVITLYDYAGNDNTINHEIGHCLSLYHIWGNTQVATVCGDDGVDDTPPTKGHNPSGCGPANIYDTACSVNYFKIYTSSTGLADSLVNYPDTNNSQNIMDYTYCSRMFTIGQVERMHACLNSSVAGRNNLWDSTNLVYTGVFNSSYDFIGRPDFKPIPAFFAAKAASEGGAYTERQAYFTFPGTNVYFKNKTWNDTVVGMKWTFSNGATAAVSTATATVTNSFTDPGWVSMTMTATGNHTGDSSMTWPRAVFVADATGTPANDIQMLFTNPDTAKWPMFNYYNNEFKWKMAGIGRTDNASLMYTGFDTRLNPTMFQYPTTGTPMGDFDDFFSVPVDFTGFSAGHASMNFDYSGASRSSLATDVSDTLIIEYTVNKGTTWLKLATLSKGSLCNKGAVSTFYTPSGPNDWAHKAIDIPAAALTPYTTFRFRYRPGVGQPDAGGDRWSSGNNFYLDNITFKGWAASVADVDMSKTNMAVVPNPTNGDAFVIVKGANGDAVNVAVTDITGKVVYTTAATIAGNQSEIQIPRTAVPVAGMYVIQATTGANTYTQKLVVY